MIKRFRYKGGPGSGNFDHCGIPGQQGGSQPCDGSTKRDALTKRYATREPYPAIPSRYVAINGVAPGFAPEPNKDKYRNGEWIGSHCYARALDAARNGKGDLYLGYVVDREEMDRALAIDPELYWGHGMYPINHAFVVDKLGRVVDPTMGSKRALESYYYGVKVDYRQFANDSELESFAISMLREDQNATVTPEWAAAQQAEFDRWNAKHASRKSTKTFIKRKGGQGSGNFGHCGIPGEQGGSKPASECQGSADIPGLVDDVKDVPSDNKLGRGYFIVPALDNKLVSITGEFGGGSNDHVGFLTAGDYGVQLGIDPKVIKAYKRAELKYFGKNQDEFNERYEQLWNDEYENLWAGVRQAGIVRVRIFGKSVNIDGLKVDHNTPGTLQDWVSTNRIPGSDDYTYTLEDTNVLAAEQYLNFSYETLMEARRLKDLRTKFTEKAYKRTTKVRVHKPH